jgi:hypothetical protein
LSFASRSKDSRKGKRETEKAVVRLPGRITGSKNSHEFPVLR